MHEDWQTTLQINEYAVYSTASSYHPDSVELASKSIKLPVDLSIVLFQSS